MEEISSINNNIIMLYFYIWNIIFCCILSYQFHFQNIEQKVYLLPENLDQLNLNIYYEVVFLNQIDIYSK